MTTTVITETINLSDGKLYKTYAFHSVGSKQSPVALPNDGILFVQEISDSVASGLLSLANGNVYFIKNAESFLQTPDFQNDNCNLIGTLENMSDDLGEVDQKASDYLSSHDFWCFRSVLNYPNDDLVPYVYRFTTREGKLPASYKLMDFLIRKGFIEKLRTVGFHFEQML